MERDARESVLRAIGRIDFTQPLAGAFVGIQLELAGKSEQAELFAHWQSRSRGNPRGTMRYRWELSHRQGVMMPSYAEDESHWIAWRSAEEFRLREDPFKFEERLMIPVILSENLELLAKCSQQGDELAAQLLREAAPVLRRDFAGFVQALDPWQDTFALWCLTRRIHALGEMHPVAVALAACYAAEVEAGAVRGIRFPFHRKPLVSASAQLASAQLALGFDLDRVGELVAFVSASRHAEGGWGDQDGEEDIMATLVASDLLLSIDPTFDFSPTAVALRKLKGGDGLWRAIGPEAPWLSAQVLATLMVARLPFAERFRFPYVPAGHRDHKTALPFFAYFAQLARLFAALPGLADSEVELGFFDLAGFREFNNAFGQERGIRFWQILPRS